MRVEEEILIPKERCRLLKNRLAELEDRLGVGLKLRDNSLVISGDFLEVRRACQVILAFGRGFELEVAMSLLSEDYVLSVIDVREWAGKSRSRAMTLKGRVIGRKGKSKRLIEEHAGVRLAIHGKTISIIGRVEGVELARQAVEMLLSGRPHGTVYRFLESKRR